MSARPGCPICLMTFDTLAARAAHVYWIHNPSIPKDWRDALEAQERLGEQIKSLGEEINRPTGVLYQALVAETLPSGGANYAPIQTYRPDAAATQWYRLSERPFPPYEWILVYAPNTECRIWLVRWSPERLEFDSQSGDALTNLKPEAITHWADPLEPEN